MKLARSTLEDWALVAEIVGGLAVVIPVIYLAVQILRDRGIRGEGRPAADEEIDFGKRDQSSQALPPTAYSLLPHTAEELGRFLVSSQPRSRFVFRRGNMN